MLAALALAACNQDVDPAWELDHDRIIAIRSAPPRIAPGEVAQIDGLVGLVGQAPVETVPDTAVVLSPLSLQSALAQDGERWTVTAPDAAALDAARAELGQGAGEPVPLQLRVTFDEGGGKSGLKVVWLGERADNPVLDPITIDGMDALAAEELTVGIEVDVPLEVDFDDRYIVNWLTSCGTMHDFDLARAYLRVETDDSLAGTLGVVVRDERGGVAWRLWPITAE